MKYNTKSADVLNEADRFEDILNWELFCMEQTNLLWGYNDKVKWTPGDPIFEHPQNVFRGGACSCCEPSNDELEGYYGHYVRPMFQTYTYLETGEDPTIPREAAQIEMSWPYMRCKDCQVSWNEGDDCWMCGQSYPRPEPKPMSFESGVVWSGLPTIELSSEGLFVTWAQDEVRQGLLNELGPSWAEIMNESMRGFSIGMRRASESMRGLSASLGVLDEWTTPISSYSINLGPIERYVPPTSPFERTAAEPIELVRPIETDFTSVRGSVELPADLDLSVRREPPLPQRPEPTDWSKWEYTPYRPPIQATQQTENSPVIKHMHYMHNGATICERPDLLGQDFILRDGLVLGDTACKDCSSLLFTHNELEFKEELERGETIVLSNRKLLRPFRAIVWSCLFASAFWIILFAAVLVVFFA